MNKNRTTTLIRIAIKILLFNVLFLVDNAVKIEYPGKKNNKSPYGISTIIYLFKEWFVMQTMDIIASKTTKMMSKLYDLFMSVFLESSNIKF